MDPQSATVLTTVLLPAALAVVMLGLGLSLTVADFARVLAQPRAVVVALACQIVVLPLACFGLVLAVGLTPTLAVGMMLLAASPGGTTANLFSHLAGGDVALNVTLTAVNSVLAAFTLPLVLTLSLSALLGAEAGIGLQADKIVQVVAIVLVPVAVGMLVARLAPRFAARANVPVKILSVLVLVGVITAAVVENRDIVLEGLRAVGLVSIAFCVLSLGVGYGVPRLFRIAHRQAVASAMEIGIHNSVLAITVAFSVLGRPELAVPAAVYGLVMFGPAALFGWLVARRAPRDSPAVPA